MSTIKPLIDPSFIQLCTEEGSPLPEQMTISEANQKGLWHQGVHVVVANKAAKTILVQKRSPRMFTHPSLLEVSLGGALKYGETFEAAALRETKEETGIEAAAQELIYVSDYLHNRAFPHLGIHSKVFSKNFILNVDHEYTFKPEDEESASAFFIPYKEVEQLIKTGVHPVYGKLAPDHAYYVQLLKDIRDYL